MRIPLGLWFGLSLGVLSPLTSSKALAETPPYGMAGCGLGSLVFERNTCQTSAATTNHSFTNQAFGITFGTSNCVGGGSAKLVWQMQDQFMSDNYATLSKEIAQGDGESLRALADMLGCQDAAYAALTHNLQNSHDKIFSAPGSVAALRVIRSEISSDHLLSTQCPDAV